jgi:mannose-6-phosphate isomerase
MQIIKAVLQPYAWGSHSFIQDFLGLKTPGALAEAWYSAHPKAPSEMEGKSFDTVVSEHAEIWLGRNWRSFPFLLKILAAEQALSIQVHPSLDTAKEGFARENASGIALDSPIRNYKDPNHKPEMMMALTDFYALCGIRDFHEILSIFQHFALESFFPAYQEFEAQPNPQTFSRLYQEVLIRKALPGLREHVLKLPKQGAWDSEVQWAKKLALQHPQDRSIISPMLLNLIHMKPLEAIFLEEGVVHAYLKGAGIEIMAQSDNVLRAGLSPKHMDIPELLKVMSKQPYLPKLYPVQDAFDSWTAYSVPVKDFMLSRIRLERVAQLPKIDGPKILLVLEGHLELSNQTQTLKLHKADAVAIPAAEEAVLLSGKAHVLLASPAPEQD